MKNDALKKKFESIYTKFNFFYIITLICDGAKTKGEDVLLIGMGASGLDLMLQLQNVANRITISRKKPLNTTEDVPLEHQEKTLSPNTTLKDTVKCFTSDGVEFIDGSRQSFTTIIYTTGANKMFFFVA